MNIIPRGRRCTVAKPINNDQQSERTIIHLKTKSLVLVIKDFGSSDINVEDLLQIHTFNLIADIITFPVLFNRIGNIKAEIDNLLRETQFDFKIFEAQKYEEHKKKLIGIGEKATETGIDMAIKRDPAYKVKMFEVFSVQRQAEIVDALYWSAKSKDKKLEVMSAKLKPEEFEKEILEMAVNKSITLNSVTITSFMSQLPERR